MAPDTIGRYRVLRQLGAGGMGEVYLGEDLALKRLVAIKMLPSASGGDETADARLVREAQAAATLDHPNVCAIYEVGEHDGQPFHCDAVRRGRDAG
jgi:eukaryotic-like serine/threonine-protein kinase